FNIQRSSFEQNIGTRSIEPRAYVVWGGHSCPPTARGCPRIQSQQRSRIQALGIADKSEPPRRNASDAECDPMFVAKSLGALCEKPHQRAVDVAETEKAEIKSLADIESLLVQLARLACCSRGGKFSILLSRILSPSGDEFDSLRFADRSVRATPSHPI